MNWEACFSIIFHRNELYILGQPKGEKMRKLLSTRKALLGSLSRSFSMHVEEWRERFTRERRDRESVGVVSLLMSLNMKT